MDMLQRLDELNTIGIAFSSEHDISRLLENVLKAAKRITNADAGILYLLDEEQKVLQGELIRTESSCIVMGGRSGAPIMLDPILLHDKAGKPNHANAAAYAALTGMTVNTPDTYTCNEYDYSDTRAFDQRTGYRSTSCLTVPMLDHKGETIGVLQLINSRDQKCSVIIPFNRDDEHLTESLSSHAAIALTNRRLFEQLGDLGIALSSERNINRLLEIILMAAKRITRADAGTLYLLDTERRALRFEIIRTDSLGISMGGTSGKPISFPPVRLYDEAGKPNHANVAAYAALSGKTVNIDDAYAAEGFDFSGTKAFDQKTGYRSTSFLTVPMLDHEGEIIGVLQLINALNRQTDSIIPFPGDDVHLTESLSSQAAIALTNRRLIKQLEDLFESLIGLINTAIDEKSPYTGGHCERVPKLTMLLAEAVNSTHQGPLKDFSMSERDKYELKIAGLLHDCGKITTPVHVVDKSTKLQTLFDRIHLVDARFEVLKRDAEITMLRALHEEQEKKDTEAIRAEYEARIRQLDEDREFLRQCNIGGEFMSEEMQQRVRQIATYQWRDTEGKTSNFLSDTEVENLNIRAGTLSAEEREIINHHIDVTIKMLESLPWPKHLKNVPEYAGGHHERMDGKGYPKGLTREQMSLQARMMGIADIFEALTAKDRPYKKGKTLTESLAILGKFKLGGHIDPDLFDIFVREKVYLTYAKQFLSPEQIDEVDLSKIPGYQP